MIKKKLFAFLFVFILFIPILAFTATDVTFLWDSNTESDLAGYRLYQSDQSGVYVYGPNSPDLVAEIHTGPNPGGTETVVLAIEDGTYFFVATAYDTEGLESEPSIEITDMFNGPPGCPKTFRITFV